MSEEPIQRPLPLHPCSQPCEVACPYTSDFFQLQKLESLGLMVGQVAHDLNNMLSIILGHAELAIEEAAEAGSPSRRLNDILEATHNATSLCHGLLSFAGRSDPVRAEVDLAKLVAQFQQLLRVTVPRQSRLECVVSPELPHLSGNPSHFRQILMNLILNAVEALGGKPGRIRLEVDRVAGKDLSVPRAQAIRIRVSDTGIGMDEEVAGNLFKPFFSTKAKGRGLGLTAVRTLVEAMDGTVTARSILGEGTTFTVLFPVELDAQVEPSLDMVDPAEPGGDAQGTGTVLLADDEPELRMLGSAMLAGAGLHVLTATDGYEAVECFRNNAGAIDLVFLDAAMPRMDGCEALAQIRQIDPSAMVIMISGHTQLDLARQWNGYKPDDILLKPVSAKQLRRAALRCLAQRAALRKEG